jgi:hypothetical protein
MPLDMLDRLSLDPGTRTLGELLQEREWVVSEIRHLRVDVDRFLADWMRYELKETWIMPKFPQKRVSIRH